VGLDTHLRLAVAREMWSPLQRSPRPSLPARLVAVVCAFDLLTRSTSRNRGLTPDHAMRVLASRADSRYDRRILRLFASAIGIFPAGSVLDLSDGSVALVTNGATGSGRPTLRLIRHSPVAPVSPARTEGGSIAIAGCADPAERGVNVIHYFMPN
ncbi:MAG TPA: hypothetical protein VMT00_03360, partial [Thermoanaerobaculia bacterium]|nr:hypothetical protein [Thermoanaerobaculia bacterium]